MTSARCMVCGQPYELHPDALDRAIAAWTGTRVMDDGFCLDCRALIDMTPEQHARYMAEIRAAIDDYMVRGEPLPEPAREWLARQTKRSAVDD